jgi:hypothetical protein
LRPQAIYPVFLTFSTDELVDCFDWPAALVWVSEVLSFGVVVDEPSVEVGLYRAYPLDAHTH